MSYEMFFKSLLKSPCVILYKIMCYFIKRSIIIFLFPSNCFLCLFLTFQKWLHFFDGLLLLKFFQALSIHQLLGHILHSTTCVFSFMLSQFHYGIEDTHKFCPISSVSLTYFLYDVFLVKF